MIEDALRAIRMGMTLCHCDMALAHGGGTFYVVVRDLLLEAQKALEDM